MTTKRIDLDKVDFFELLAHEANNNKATLVSSLIPLLAQGDKAAFNILQRAFELAAPKTDKNKELPILGGITQKYKAIDYSEENEKQNALSSNNSAISDPRASEAS